MCLEENQLFFQPSGKRDIVGVHDRHELRVCQGDRLVQRCHEPAILAGDNPQARIGHGMGL